MPSAGTGQGHGAGAGLDVSHVTVRFGGVVALDNVSLRVEPSQVVGVIGPNGAGKTTLFNTLCGFVRPASGGITYRGRPLIGRPPHELAALGIARTLQGLGLWPSLTVLENVMMAAPRRPGLLSGLLGLPTADAQDRRAAARAMELLSELRIADRARAHPPTLPHGVQRRVSLARALMSEPSLLLLDEPASGLSAQEVQELAGLLRPLRERMAVVVVEHNMDLVMAISDRVTVLSLGRVIAEGTPEEIRNDPQVAVAYLGEEADGRACSR
jgi:branched-chain amino acid transport system ATP-binding protein